VQDVQQQQQHVGSVPPLRTRAPPSPLPPQPRARAALEVFKQIPELKCLYLKGNPLVSNMKNYRKTMVASMPCLTYLDERPVFEDERRLTMAWSVGPRRACALCGCLWRVRNGCLLPHNSHPQAYRVSGETMHMVHPASATAT